MLSEGNIGKVNGMEVPVEPKGVGSPFGKYQSNNYYYYCVINKC